MLQFNQLSFWEKQTILEEIDFIIIGAGIVGSACAIRLREHYPSAKIVLLERGYLSTGASTKNAGFACFGSVSEIADDLETMSETEVWDTVAMRYAGLRRLQERFSAKALELIFPGSWDLITTDEAETIPTYSDKMAYFNSKIEAITNQKECYSFDSSIGKKCGFNQIAGGFSNRLEGELNTGKLILETNALLAKNNIICLYGIKVLRIEKMESEICIETTFGEIRSKKVAVTVNGFANELLNDNRISPARAQVVVTSPIHAAPLPGSFHYQKGYYYFRSVGNRILLGGGRNIDFEGETTTEFQSSPQISKALISLLNTTILPNQSFTIDYSWSGIMGVGPIKKPIIELIHPRIGIGVRMGGMGVAIGSLVGEELADLIA